MPKNPGNYGLMSQPIEDPAGQTQGRGILHSSTQPIRALEQPPAPPSEPGRLKVVPPRPAALSARPGARKGSHADAWAVAISCAIPLGITIWGVRYYFAPLGVRLRHPLNSLLRPSGPVGLTLGVVGLVLFLFMWLYPLRKSVRWLAWTGPLGEWMRVHIVAGLAIPLIVAVHAGWRFDGLIGLGYVSMFIVSLSGVVGRYLYVRIPRSRTGLELSMEEVNGERRALVANIAGATGLEPADVERQLAVDSRSYEGLDPLRTFLRMVRDDVMRHRTLRRLERELRRPRAGRVPLRGNALRETLRLARRELTLAQQVRALETTRKVFGYWHVAHRPFAITAFFAVIIHVIVAVVIGGIGFSGSH